VRNEPKGTLLDGFLALDSIRISKITRFAASC